MRCCWLGGCPLVVDLHLDVVIMSEDLLWRVFVLPVWVSQDLHATVEMKRL